MVVVEYQPRQIARKRVIENTLAGMQEVVEGYIEVIRLGAPDGMAKGREFVMVVNEEGRLKNLPPNLALGSTLIVGPVFIAIQTADDIVGLTDEEHLLWMMKGDSVLRRV